MRVLIIEDEVPAANRLAVILQDSIENMEVVKEIDCVSSAIQCIPELPSIDLIFMDIQVADELSFDIFEQIDIQSQ